MCVPQVCVRFSLTAEHGFALILHKKQVKTHKQWRDIFIKKQKTYNILRIAAVFWLLIIELQEQTMSNCAFSMILWPRKTIALLY